jgi:nicotinamidase-related amidase
MTAPTLPASAALLIIDLQKAIDAPYWGRRNNPGAETNVARLLAAWRASGRPIYHVRHDSTEPQSAYRPGQPGNDFKPEAMPLPGETVIVKRANSAFIGTDLEQRLRAAGHATLVVAGVITNNSVEATVRMAGNLGFATHVVSDATFTVDKRLLDGRTMPAEEVHALSLANMHGEYATVVGTDEVVAAVGAPPGYSEDRQNREA